MREAEKDEDEEREWNEREEGLVVVEGESEKRRGVAEEVVVAAAVERAIVEVAAIGLDGDGDEIRR